MTKKMIGLLVLIILGGMGSIGLSANDNLHYGYISYLDGEAKVIRLDGSQTRATINLPLVPGDKLVTGEKDRCEIQFDNGTVMRLDKNSVLRIETILAESLTSSRKLTTLYLDQGEIYSLVKSYKKENFQVITPNSAILMKTNSLNTIDVDKEDGTSIYVERGSVKVIYGREVKNLKRATIKRKKGYRITIDHQLVEGLKRDLEFVFWNERINKKYKELHYGVSRVPKPIYRYSKGIIEFAEKWSTLYGEWLYDDIFGYVWQPYQKQFAWSQRPFYQAQHVNVNGQLFLVPSQRWGWAPAHLGNWVWMNKRGWVWIPGDAFTPGVQNNMFVLFNLTRFYNPYFYWSRLFWGNADSFYYNYLYYPTFSDWFNRIYGSEDLYHMYRENREKYYITRVSENAPGIKRKVALKDVPKHIRVIIKRMNRAPLAVIEKKLFGNKRRADIRFKQPEVRRLDRPAATPVVKPLGKNIIAPVKVAKRGPANFRTWCPDKRWGQLNLLKIQYSSRTNAVICKELGLNSNHMNIRARIALKHANFSQLVPASVSRYGSRSSRSSGPVGSTSTGSSSTSRTSSGGSKGGKKK